MQTNLYTSLAAAGYMIEQKANPAKTIFEVKGKNGQHFKAKNKLANRITAELNRLPFVKVAWNLQDRDGFFNFYVK